MLNDLPCTVLIISTLRDSGIGSLWCSTGLRWLRDELDFFRASCEGDPIAGMIVVAARGRGLPWAAFRAVAIVLETEKEGESKKRIARNLVNQVGRCAAPSQQKACESGEPGVVDGMLLCALDSGGDGMCRWMWRNQNTTPLIGILPKHSKERGRGHDFLVVPISASLS